MAAYNEKQEPSAEHVCLPLPASIDWHRGQIQLREKRKVFFFQLGSEEIPPDR